MKKYQKSASIVKYSHRPLQEHFTDYHVNFNIISNPVSFFFFTPKPLISLSSGIRTEQDLYVRLIDSMTKQVSEQAHTRLRTHTHIRMRAGLPPFLFLLCTYRNVVFCLILWVGVSARCVSPGFFFFLRALPSLWLERRRSERVLRHRGVTLLLAVGSGNI